MRNYCGGVVGSGLGLWLVCHCCVVLLEVAGSKHNLVPNLYSMFGVVVVGVASIVLVGVVFVALVVAPGSVTDLGVVVGGDCGCCWCYILGFKIISKN
jgi:hypothetical protein